MNPELLLAFEQIEAQFWRAMMTAVPEEQRRQLGMRVVHLDAATLALTGKYGEAGILNQTTDLGLRRPATDADIGALRAALSEYDVASMMVGLHPLAEPADLSALLTAHGATFMMNFLIMGRAAAPMPEPSGAVQVQEVGPEAADALITIMMPSHGLPEDLDPMFRHTIGQPNWHYYLATLDGEPVAGGALFVQGEVALLASGATLEPYRKLGAQSALIHRRVQDAAALGIKHVCTLVVESTPEQPNPSEHNMRRAGFEVAYRHPGYRLDRLLT